MTLEISDQEFRYLIDLVYLGNWVMNSAREQTDRIAEYDAIEEKILRKCVGNKFQALVTESPEGILPSRAFEDGGILEVISEYEDAVFFDMLAEELAHRDMEDEGLNPGDAFEFDMRMNKYLTEFEENGITNVKVLS